MDRAVIYCRVSTEEEKQLNALEKQIDEARSAVSNNDWFLVDEYVDEGKSGTMVKFRNEFIRLSEDLTSSKFDIIVVKSQDRLMRSTKDWYIFIDKVVQNKKKLFFYLENRFYNADDALLTGIRAILAEEYSRELSKKLNNAHRYRQKNKGNIILTNMTWGYDNINKEIVINKDEAEVIKLMFEYSAQGIGTRTIAKVLANKGWLSRSGKPFSDGTIVGIIRNPLYKGTALMNKVHYDFNTKKSIHTDRSEWIYKENAVPPIVDEKLWQRANDMMDDRIFMVTRDDGTEVIQGKYPGKYPLSSKLICGECGSTYWIRKYYKKGNTLEKVWSCSTYIRHGRLTTGHCEPPKWKKVDSVLGCDNIHLNFNQLNDVLLELSSYIRFDKGETKKNLMNILKSTFEENNGTDPANIEMLINDVVNKREILLDAFLDKMIDEPTYRRKDEKLALQEKQLQSKISEEIKHNSTNRDIGRRLDRLEKEIDTILDQELALDFICRHINQVTVYREKLDIEFDMLPKCEILIEQINHRKKQMTIKWDISPKQKKMLSKKCSL